MSNLPTNAPTDADLDWANAQFDAIEPTKQAAREFDASEDGARYLRITGATMWANLGADSLPADAEEAAELA